MNAPFGSEVSIFDHYKPMYKVFIDKTLIYHKYINLWKSTPYIACPPVVLKQCRLKLHMQYIIILLLNVAADL